VKKLSLYIAVILSLKPFLRTSSKPNNPNQASSMERLQRLGRELLTSRAHVNNAPILISVLASCLEDKNKSDQGLEALMSLQAFFLPLLRTELETSAVKEASQRLKRKMNEEGE
jgi:U3 small nucleolar RNA-associated protein 19